MPGVQYGRPGRRLELRVRRTRGEAAGAASAKRMPISPLPGCHRSPGGICSFRGSYTSGFGGKSSQSLVEGSDHRADRSEHGEGYTFGYACSGGSRSSPCVGLHYTHARVYLGFGHDAR